MLKEIIIAIAAYRKAHMFIREHRLWKWIIIPGIFYFLLFIAGIYFYMNTSYRVVQFLFTEIGIKKWLEAHNQSVINFLFLFGQVILQLVMLLFYFSWFKYFFLIIGSPVFAYLSEKTESIMLNKDFPFSFSRLITDAWRGVRIAFRNAFWQTLFTLFIFFLSLIPLVGWIAPLLALGVECYYLGFSMLDYTNERRGYGFSRSIDFINKNRGLAIGNGMIFYLGMAIPVIGWIVSPGYAVVAATLSLQEKPKLIPDFPE